jgi:N-carbamoyl-L-amino-acid hydrolase
VRRTRLIFRGQADHAGTTPMERRRDAFLASAEYSLRARDLIVERGGGRSVTNIGVVYVHPGVSNIVPGRAELLHEMRSPDADTLERLAQACEALASEIGTRRGIGVELKRTSATTPVACSPRVQAAVKAAAGHLGLGCTTLYSAAGHDAQNLALITDSGMLFIPSRGGKSHRVDETSDPEAIERGANVLLRTLLDLAA